MPEDRKLNIANMTLKAFDRTQTAVIVESKVLGGKIVLASNDWRLAANQAPCPYPIYRVSEVLHLLKDQNLNPEGLKLIHEAKAQFNATITGMKQEGKE